MCCITGVTVGKNITMVERWVYEIKKLIIFAAVVILCLWKFDIVEAFFKTVFHIILPFLLGGAIAFVLGVPMNFIEKRLFSFLEKELFSKRRKSASVRFEKIKRPLSLFIVVFLLLIIIAVVFMFLIPELIDTTGQLGERIGDAVQDIYKYVRTHFYNSEILMMVAEKLMEDSDRFMQIVVTFFQKGSNYAIQDMMYVIRKIVSGTATFLISVVFACYVLLQKERLKIQARKVLYAFVEKGKADAVCEVLALVYETFVGFLTGQCLEAAILGTLFLIIMSVLHFPYALLISVVIGFTALVPIFGSIVGFIIGVLLLIIADPVKALTFVILFFVLQQIEGNFIYPHVVGNSVGLPSIWVFSAVTMGGRLMGVVGMLLFIPLASVSYALFREIVKILHRKRQVEYLFSDDP